MMFLERIGDFFGIVLSIAADPINLAILFGSVLLGIMFGAMPGLTSTLGVALLTALTYGMDTSMAMVCLLAIYVGAQFPESALWVIGLLFGIEMVFSGWSFIMIAMAAKAARKGADPAPAGETPAAEPAAG